MFPTKGIILMVANPPGSRISPVWAAVNPSRFWQKTGNPKVDPYKATPSTKDVNIPMEKLRCRRILKFTMGKSMLVSRHTKQMTEAIVVKVSREIYQVENQSFSSPFSSTTWSEPTAMARKRMPHQSMRLPLPYLGDSRTKVDTQNAAIAPTGMFT